MIFTFKIKNNGTLPASYNLYIKILEDSTLDESNIKYSLTNNNTIKRKKFPKLHKCQRINSGLPQYFNRI